MYTILFINDEPEQMRALESYNTENNIHYCFTEIDSSVDVLKTISEHSYSLILISCSISGLANVEIELIKTLKFNSVSREIPLILCTKKHSDEDHILFLTNGADDVFHTKLSLELLFCKINAILRKKDCLLNNVNSFDSQFIFLEESYELDFKGIRHKLTSKEFVILRTLVKNPNKTFSQTELNELSSGKDVYVSKRCIDTFVSILRKKIGKNCITSIRNKGYRMNNKILDFNFALN